MASAPVFIGAPMEWQAAVSAANTNRDGTGTIVDVATGGSSGSLIEKLKAVARATTTPGVIRFYLYDGTNTYLIMEMIVPAITPGVAQEVWSKEVAVEIVLPTSAWKLRASTHIAESFNLFAKGGNY